MQPLSRRFHHIYSFLCTCALIAIGAASPVFAQKTVTLPGTWVGTLNVMGQKLRIVFHIERKSDTSYAATLDSPDQGAKGIAVQSVQWDGASLTIAVPSIMGAYKGTPATDSSMTGSWSQGGMSLPLDIVRTTQSVEVRRPQVPVRPYPYDEEEITFQNASAGVTLAGTLTKPKDAKASPCVVLITGSGPQNRNESIFGHDPFLIIADYLTRRGIAVLRCDDRGIGKSTGSFAKATTDDFASDARAAVAYLRSRSDIDRQRIGLIGHSEGGVIAPMVAAENGDIAFIVLLAGTGILGEQILYLQQELIARANGASEEDILTDRRFQEKLYAVLKTGADTATMHRQIRELYRAQLEASPDSVKLQVEKQSAAVMERQLQTLTSAWFMRFLTLDPKEYLRKVHCPVLALNGELDLQVPWKENLPAIEAALKEAGNTDVTTKMLPRLNHLFQTATTGNIPEYATIEETVSPKALELMAEWIAARTK
jgi:uncharacterized protein